MLTDSITSKMDYALVEIFGKDLSHIILVFLRKTMSSSILHKTVKIQPFKSNIIIYRIILKFNFRLYKIIPNITGSRELWFIIELRVYLYRYNVIGFLLLLHLEITLSAPGE